MKIAWLMLFSLAGCQTTPKVPTPPKVIVETSKSTALTVPASAFDGSQERFQKHDGYLAMSLPYPPFAGLFAQLEARGDSKLKLLNRGEAHITVLSPPEENVLKSRLSQIDIDAAAEKIGIQTTEVQPICIGQGRVNFDGVEQSTYFVVVRAANLLRIRHEIQRMFVSFGGDKAKFNADHFFPHVTLGFTKSDLFEEQGVIKDEKSCKYPLVAVSAQP